MKIVFMLKKLIKVGEIFLGLILVLVIIVSVFPLLPPFKNYYHSRTVLSGSMEPKITKGSVVINQWLEQKNLQVGDVITYQHSSRKNIIYITHRIVKIDKSGLLFRFKTKGDANPASDFGLVTQANIEGKVILMIPLIGYLIELFKTPLGFVFLIALPLLIFIAQQTRDVLQIWKKGNVIDKKPITKHKRHKQVKRKTRRVLTILFAFALLAARVSLTAYASFTSGQARIIKVALNTSSSFASSPPSVSPTPTPAPEVSQTPIPSPTLEISPAATPTAEVFLPTPEATSTAQLSPVLSTTPSPSPQPIPTVSPEPSSSANPEPTSTPTPTFEPTVTIESKEAGYCFSCIKVAP